jgi:hypothetical protein
MTEGRLFEFDEPDRDDRVNPETVRRFMPAWLARTAPNDPNGTIRLAWRLMAECLVEQATFTRQPERCGWFLCPRPAEEADHLLPKRLAGSRIAEYLGTRPLCAIHHRLITALDAADREVEVRERVTEELLRRAREGDLDR